MKHRFPVESLRPRPGILSLVPFENGTQERELFHSIEIPLEPFWLKLDASSVRVTTALRLDFISFGDGLVDPEQLAGRTFTFPINPAPGYIDASVYIEHRHHPVDVRRIQFGDFTSGRLLATFELDIVFEHEGLERYANEHGITLATTLEVGSK